MSGNESRGRIPTDAHGENPIVDEVRRIRASICEEFGNDVDRLCDHLIQVDRDFDARRGVFACVTQENAARVVAGWGTDPYRTDDPLIDEVREIRRKLGEESKPGAP